MFQVARPKPITASGGINATAIATPTIAPWRPRIIAKVPARPEKIATPRSNRFGRVRAAISLVTDCSGEIVTIRAQSRTASRVPAPSEKIARRISEKSNRASPKPKPMIGPMSGEISIAPITTAGEDSSRPRIAIPADIRVMNAKWPDQKASSWTRSMTSR